jgi:excisionase family DNA binding protein
MLDQHPNVYSPRTLSERWECSEHHVRNLISKGLLPAFRLGGKLLRIRVADVVEFENRHESEPLEEVVPPAVAEKKPRAKRLDTDFYVRRILAKTK